MDLINHSLGMLQGESTLNGVILSEFILQFPSPDKHITNNSLEM